MQNLRNPLIRTRTTLIRRLGNWKDQTSWQEFFDNYAGLIFAFAVKSGLSETEAQDVLQETMLSVAKNIPTFRYDRALGSFKTWLLTMTRWRVTDQFRKRDPAYVSSFCSDQEGGPPMTENLADPNHSEFENLWEKEWKQHLLDAAMMKVKRNVDPQQYQLFHLYADRGWAPEKVARTFKVSVNQVYLAKSRVSEMVRTEVKRLAQGIA